MNLTNKIEIVLTYKHDPEDEEIFIERVDAEKHGDYYRLVHVPAFAKNIAYGDIVKVEFDDGDFHFEELVEESGYSVIHIVVFMPESKDRVITTLTKFQCGVNIHVADNYLVISVPPEILYEQIKSYLLSEKSYNNIDFRESCLSERHRQGLNK